MKKLFNLRAWLVVAGTLVALWLVIVHTGSNYYDAKQPQVALAFDGDNNFALSKIATAALVGGQAQSLDLDTASQFALKAVRAAPRDSDGLAVLGFAADAGTFDTEGYPLVERAQRYSKRSLIAQIYLINHYAQKGDASRTLEFYNLALTTQPSSQRLLLPQLYKSLAYSGAQLEIIKLLKRDPLWKKEFWLGLSSLQPVPPEAIRLYEAVHSDKVAVIPGIGARLARGLASEGRFAEAIRMANLGGGSSVVSVPRDLDDFINADAAPPIDWEFSNSGSHSSEASAEAMLLSVRGTKDVIFATRLLALPAGRQLSLSALAGSEGGGARIGMTMLCAASNRPIGSDWVEVPDGSSVTLKLAELAIPSDCPFQWLTISGRSAGMHNADLAIHDIVVRGGAAQ